MVTQAQQTVTTDQGMLSSAQATLGSDSAALSQAPPEAQNNPASLAAPSAMIFSLMRLPAQLNRSAVQLGRKRVVRSVSFNCIVRLADRGAFTRLSRTDYALATIGFG